MGNLIRQLRLAAFLAMAAVTVLGATSRADYSISNNLTGTSGGVESATGSTWITAGFGSGATGGTLSSVTLLLANSSVAGTVGAAEVDIYSDDTLEPGAKVGALTLSGAYSSSLTNTTFTATGITLAANTNYWVVLKALSGQFDWSWTATNTGTGSGYQNTWGESDDSGSSWFTYDSYPTQMNVTLVSAAAVPEPGSFLLLGTGLAGVATIWGRVRSRRAVAG